MGRVLAFDHGGRRLGVAVAASETGVATGLDTIVYDGWKDLRARLTGLVEEQGPERLIVGYPLGMDGQPTPRCEEVETFARRLVGWFGLPVTLWDERLTTAQARRAQRESGRSEKKARQEGLRDRAAAILLLQSWLDHPDRVGIAWSPHPGPGNDDAGEESAGA